MTVKRNHDGTNLIWRLGSQKRCQFWQKGREASFGGILAKSLACFLSGCTMNRHPGWKALLQSHNTTRNCFEPGLSCWPVFAVIIQFLVDESLSWETDLLEVKADELDNSCVLMCALYQMQIWPHCLFCCSPWWPWSRPTCCPCPRPAAGTRRSLAWSVSGCAFAWSHCRQYQWDSHGYRSGDALPG